MGTSSSNPGPSPDTPLLPTWADPPIPIPLPGDKPSPLVPPPDVKPRPPIKPLAPGNQRFRDARNNFTQFASSGGNDMHSLGKAVHGYVRTAAGGSRTAARRMGASRRTAAKLVSVLSSFQSSGVSETLHSLSLDHLVGQPPKQILLALTEVVGRPSGTIDENISRTAYLETAREMIIGGVDLNALTVDQIGVIATQFISHSIVLTILNTIGTKFDVKALSADRANKLLKSLKDFVFGAVRDQLHGAIRRARNMSQQQLVTSMTRIYASAFDLLDRQARRLR